MSSRNFDTSPYLMTLRLGNRRSLKAKSPLELLDLFGERITRDELDRFFQIAKRVLVAPDPELELPRDTVCGPSPWQSPSQLDC